MGRRLYAWVVVALLGLRPTIEVLEAVRPAREDHAAHLQMPDEGPHDHVPTVVSDPPPPPSAPSTVMRDIANRVAIMAQTTFDPAFYLSPFRR